MQIKDKNSLALARQIKSWKRGWKVLWFLRV